MMLLADIGLGGFLVAMAIAVVVNIIATAYMTGDMVTNRKLERDREKLRELERRLIDAEEWRRKFASTFKVS